MLPVNEVFETLQGEAYWTGTPAVFLRLQGCEVGCPWCDTKHTWTLDPAFRADAETMLAKTADSPSYTLLDVGAIVALLDRFASRHVVVTGGEPCNYDLRTLTHAVLASGRHVQIETSGTRPVLCHPDSWVTVSPKIGMLGGFDVLPEALHRADEIKMPVGKPADLDKLDVLLAKVTPRRGMVWLQPLSQSEKATRLCIAAARARNWRVSLQVHKFVGLP